MKLLARHVLWGASVCWILSVSSAHALRLSFDLPDTANNQILDSASTDADYPVVYGNHVNAFSMTNAGIVYNYGSEGGITDQIGVDFFAPRYRKNATFANMTNSVSIFSTVNRHVFLDTTNDPAVSLRLLSVDVGIIERDTGGRASTSSLYVAVYTNNTTEIWRKSTAVFGTNAHNETIDFTALDDTSRSLSAMKGTVQLYFIIPGLTTLGASYGYDNIIFTQIPEPSTLTLGVAAVAIVLLYRRR